MSNLSSNLEEKMKAGSASILRALPLPSERLGDAGMRCNETKSGKSNLQYELLFKF